MLPLPAPLRTIRAVPRSPLRRDLFGFWLSCHGGLRRSADSLPIPLGQLLFKQVAHGIGTGSPPPPQCALDVGSLDVETNGEADRDANRESDGGLLIAFVRVILGG